MRGGHFYRTERYFDSHRTEYYYNATVLHDTEYRGGNPKHLGITVNIKEFMCNNMQCAPARSERTA